MLLISRKSAAEKLSLLGKLLESFAKYHMYTNKNL